MNKDYLITIIVAIILFLLLVFQLYSILNPILVFALIFLLLSKFLDKNFAKLLLGASIFLLFYWFFYISKGVLIPFFIGLVLAYLVNPLLKYLEKKKISRFISTLCIFMIIIGVLTIIVLVLVPQMINQLQIIMQKIYEYNESADKLITWLESKLNKFNIKINIREEFFNKIPSKMTEIINYAMNLLGTIPQIINQIMNIIFIPITFFYFAVDFDNFSHLMKGLIPKRYLRSSLRTFKEIEKVTISYMKGVLLVSTILGVLTGIPLAIIGYDFALLLGVLTAILSIIPYIGVFTSLLIGTTLAFMSPNPMFMVISVLVVFSAVQFLEGNFITPKIMGKQIGLHPLIVMMSLVLGAKFFGFWGMVVAVPVTAILKIFVFKIINIYRNTDFYTDYKGKIGSE